MSGGVKNCTVGENKGDRAGRLNGVRGMGKGDGRDVRDTHEGRRGALCGGGEEVVGEAEGVEWVDRAGGAERERLYSSDEAKHPRGLGPNKAMG